jgi:hypothetical protein
MPLINVIPPGLDFSSLKVDLPMDPSRGKGPPPKHASFSHLASNPTSPRSSDGSSPSPEKLQLDHQSASGKAAAAMRLPPSAHRPSLCH